jgi:uncharacterized protein (TIGR02996 family)
MAMQAAVNQNPLDTVTRLVYADALEESGSYKESCYQRRFAQRLEKPLTDKQIKQLSLDLDRANGKRRERTLSLENCIHCARSALLDDDRWSYVAGGTVANAYKYRSYQTVCVAAVRSNGTIRIGVAVTSGTKGSSPTTPVCGIAKNADRKVFRTWADNYSVIREVQNVNQV